MFPRDQLKRAATLTEEDFVQLGKCRRPHNRLGFADQVAFVRLFNRFPQQQPFELLEELVCFSAAQLGLDAGLIELYRKRQPTISEHQQTIAAYLRLRPFDAAEAAQLGQFLFEESCRLEQAAALMGRARELLLGYSKEECSLLSVGSYIIVSRAPIWVCRTVSDKGFLTLYR